MGLDRAALAVAATAALFASAPGAAQAPAAAAVQPDAGTPFVTGSVHRIRSSVYGDEQVLTVRLPAGYAEEPERRWPVVYVIDGGPAQDFAQVAGLAATAELSGSIAPFIVIGVETKNRYAQLTPPESEAGRTERLTRGTINPGGYGTFRDYLVRDVMPWAEARYRTGRRLVIGESLAGLFVLYTFLKDPGTFDDYVSITPSLWWDDGRVAEDAAADLARHGPSDRRLYLTMADEGLRTQANLDRIVTALQAGAPEGLGWTYVDRSGSEEHRTIYATAALDALRAFYLVPARTGSVNPFEFEGHRLPTYSREARANLDAGKCRPEIAVRVTFAEKNADPDRYWGQCLMMKPGARPTAGNLEVWRARD